MALGYNEMRSRKGVNNRKTTRSCRFRRCVCSLQSSVCAPTSKPPSGLIVALVYYFSNAKTSSLLFATCILTAVMQEVEPGRCSHCFISLTFTPPSAEQEGDQLRQSGTCTTSLQQHLFIDYYFTTFIIYTTETQK